MKDNIIASLVKSLRVDDHQSKGVEQSAGGDTDHGETRKATGKQAPEGNQGAPARACRNLLRREPVRVRSPRGRFAVNSDRVVRGGTACPGRRAARSPSETRQDEPQLAPVGRGASATGCASPRRKGV